MKNKIVILVLVCLLMVSGVHATTLNNLPDVDAKTVVTYNGNIQSEFKTIDSDDGITRITVWLENGGWYNNTGTLINLENNVSVKVVAQSYFWLLLPRLNVTTTIYFQNYTVYNYSFTYANTFIRDIKINIAKDGNTSLQVNENGFVGLDDARYSTPQYLGLPSQDVLITAVSPFDVELAYEPINLAERPQLSIISTVIYYLLNTAYKLVSFDINAESESIYDILLFFDGLLWVISILFLAVFTYPNLLLVWVLIIGNITVAWKATTMREIIFNYVDYFKWIFGKAYSLVMAIWTMILRIITAILTAIP